MIAQHAADRGDRLMQCFASDRELDGLNMSGPG